MAHAPHAPGRPLSSALQSRAPLAATFHISLRHVSHALPDGRMLLEDASHDFTVRATASSAATARARRCCCDCCSANCLRNPAASSVADASPPCRSPCPPARASRWRMWRA